MIRLYFDWNVYVNLKRDEKNELNQILAKNKHRFNIYYSTSHIGDIYKSYSESTGITEEIESDLDFITQITNNNCFFRTNEDIVVNRVEPRELLEDRVDSEKNMQNAFALFSSKGNDDDVLSGILDLLSAIPFSIELDENQRTEMSKLLPVESNVLTMKDITKAVTSLFTDLYTTEKYKDLREVFQKGMGINRDKLYNSSDPFPMIDEHFKKSSLKENTFNEFQENIHKLSNQTPKNWFDKIHLEYLNLDITGYKEDKIEVSDRKSDTMRNTLEDAFHASFASQCDFYITNDNRNFHKTIAVYDKHEINTRVYKQGEFLDYLKEYIMRDESINIVDNIFDSLNNSAFYEWQNEDGERHQTHYLKYFVLDFFNKIHWRPATENKKDDWMILLTKEKPSNGRFTLVNDIQMLVAKLIRILNIPKCNKLFLTDDEIMTIQNFEPWEGRSWEFDTMYVELKCLNGYSQLYLVPYKIPDTTTL